MLQPPGLGDVVFYRAWNGNISRGTVIQPGSERTQVFWPDLACALWMPTRQLWSQRPSWTLDEPCVCSCSFGQHSDWGCVLHQTHEFVPNAARLNHASA